MPESKEQINYDEKIVSWFKDRYNLIFFTLIVGTVIIRLYYFFLLKAQPIWWDEGDYLAIAKVWALGQVTPEWWSHFTGIRPLLLPIIWSLMFKIGLGELSLRFFTILLPSIGTVLLSYLLGRDLYNKKVGLIAGTMMSTYWVLQFYSFRLLTDIPAVFFGLLSMYFFWSFYIKNSKPYGLYLCFLFGVIAFSIRFPLALVPISCMVYLLFVKRFSIFRDKTIWKGVGLGVIFLTPYIIYFIFSKFSLFKFYFGSTAVSVHQPIGWHLIPFLFSLPFLFWQIAFVLGVISMYGIVIFFDKIWKQKVTHFNADMFLIIGLLLHWLFYIIIIRDATDRWLLMLMPYFFTISSKGLVWIYDKIKKYSALVGIILVIILLFGGVQQNFSHANSLIMEKKDSYREVKLAGEWLKDNTPTDAKIVTASIVQNQYYSERDSYDYSYNSSSLPKDCVDKFGHTVENVTCQNASESLFDQKVEKIHPDYFIISVFEPVFTPAWAYNYPEKHNLTAVQAYSFPSQPNQPVLVIYKF